MALTGDFAKLGRLYKKLEKLGQSALKAEILKGLSEEALAQVQMEFDEGVDPTGSPWKSVGRGGQPLRDTGRLANSFSAASTDSGFRVFTPVPYAGTHQNGATIYAKGGALRFKVGGRWVYAKKVTIPKRQIIPTNGILGRWRKPMEDLVRSMIREAMKP